MPIDLCPNIDIMSSKESGLEYEVANGATIPNLGERRCLLMTLGAQTAKRITFQIADVHKSLMAISRVADAGYGCYLGKFGGYLIDEWSGETIPIHRKGNLYIMKAWVRRDTGEAGFTRPE